MLFRLFLCFTLIPVAELYILIHLGGILGGLNTVMLVIITGFIGAYLARMEGLNTMIKVRQNLNQGIMPAEELLDAFIILIAGLVLITPGLLTDTAGLFFLCPPTRNTFKRFLRRKFDEMTPNSSINITRFH